MPIKKKKISELTLSDNLKGLYTIGVKLINGIQTSVKVSLEYIQTAYEDAVAATKKANEAATNADNSRKQIEENEATRQKNETARVSAEKSRVNAEALRVKAESGRVSEFDTIKTNAETATKNANTQADRAKGQADNPPKMGDNGNWWKWDEKQQKYVDTGILAKGGVLYPTFIIDEGDMVLYMEFEDEVSDKLIKFDEQTGELYLNVG